jgi:hypothetical protein
MNLFEQTKESVTARMAAENYGVKISRNGMACCPFHNDKHPSMKIDKNYHCFACGVGGDAIDFTARMFGMSQYDAAKKLIEDFHLPIEIHPGKGKTAKKPKLTEEQKQKAKLIRLEKRFADWVKESTDTLSAYRKYLTFWKETFVPDPEQEEWNPLFVEALDNLQKIENYLDVLMSRDSEEKVAFFHARRKEVREIAERIAEYERGTSGEPGGGFAGGSALCG